ncbi:unnamed protein product [Symbiodinium sp. CCMP2592]|nr:unnamed protein product [Symbiodinium sp. CCMP2592]
MYCNHWCFNDFYLEPSPGGALAETSDRLSKCFSNYCQPMKMKCAKPFGEFPNSCIGELTFGHNKYMAIYAFRTEAGPGMSQVVIESRISGYSYEGNRAICTAAWNVTYGNCFGLSTASVGEEVPEPAIEPPDLPEYDYKFPHVGPTTTRTSVTQTTLTQTTVTQTTLTSTETTLTSTTVTSTTVTTSTISTTSMTTVTQTTTMVPEEQGSWFPLGLALAALLAVSAGFIILRGRRDVEAQRLRDTREVELPTMNRM